MPLVQLTLTDQLSQLQALIDQSDLDGVVQLGEDGCPRVGKLGNIAVAHLSASEAGYETCRLRELLFTYLKETCSALSDTGAHGALQHVGLASGCEVTLRQIRDLVEEAKRRQGLFLQPAQAHLPSGQTTDTPSAAYHDLTPAQQGAYTILLATHVNYLAAQSGKDDPDAAALAALAQKTAAFVRQMSSDKAKAAVETVRAMVNRGREYADALTAADAGHEHGPERVVSSLLAFTTEVVGGAANAALANGLDVSTDEGWEAVQKSLQIATERVISDMPPHMAIEMFDLAAQGLSECPESEGLASLRAASANLAAAEDPLRARAAQSLADVTYSMLIALGNNAGYSNQDINCVLVPAFEEGKCGELNGRDRAWIAELSQAALPLQLLFEPSPKESDALKGAREEIGRSAEAFVASNEFGKRMEEALDQVWGKIGKTFATATPASIDTLRSLNRVAEVNANSDELASSILRLMKERIRALPPQNAKQIAETPGALNVYTGAQIDDILQYSLHNCAMIDYDASAREIYHSFSETRYFLKNPIEFARVAKGLRELKKGVGDLSEISDEQCEYYTYLLREHITLRQDWLISNRVPPTAIALRALKAACDLGREGAESILRRQRDAMKTVRAFIELLLTPRDMALKNGVQQTFEVCRNYIRMLEAFALNINLDQDAKNIEVEILGKKLSTVAQNLPIDVKRRVQLRAEEIDGPECLLEDISRLEVEVSILRQLGFAELASTRPLAFGASVVLDTITEHCRI